jgi:hypothetical protein
MEASVEAPGRLEGDKARRIIEAMRASVGTRGAAGSTFDHVARQLLCAERSRPANAAAARA